MIRVLQWQSFTLTTERDDFAEAEQTPFKGVDNGSIAFVDVDGDSDQDLMITGLSSSGHTWRNRRREHISRLYINDGSGRFTGVQKTPFEGGGHSSIAFADVDGDSDQDLVMIGSGSLGHYGMNLYLNLNDGRYTEARELSLEGALLGSVAFADVDGDSDQDLVVTGRNMSGNSIADLYLNNGKGRFSKAEETPFEGVQSGSIAFADVDGDGDQDLVIAGKKGSGLYSQRTNLYLNISTSPASVELPLISASHLVTTTNLLRSQNFVQLPFPVEEERIFEGVERGSSVFVDVDGDSDQDLIITGRNISGKSIADIYLNNGKGRFSESEKRLFDSLWIGSLTFADVDGDSDQDLVITGTKVVGDRHNYITDLYLNDGKGRFMEVEKTPFEGVDNGSVAFADVDGDSDQDLLISGLNDSLDPTTKLYINNGKGRFSGAGKMPFEEVVGSSIAFADVDGDSDQDLLITGYMEDSRYPITKLYFNNSKGHFTRPEEWMPFEWVGHGSIAFADVDGDSDQDLVVTGRNRESKPIINLYMNDGSGRFAEIPETPFKGAGASSIAFADVDGDSDQDLVIMEWNGTIHRMLLYLNDGRGEFTEVKKTPFDGAYFSSLAFGDVDGDSDQDLVVTGVKVVGDRHDPIANLYLNTSMMPSFVEQPLTSASHLPWILIFPYSSTAAQASLSYHADGQDSLSIRIIDMAGRKVSQHNVALSAGQNIIPVNCSALPRGAYLVEMNQEKRSVWRRMLVL